MSKSKTLGKVELELLQYVDENQPVTVRQVADYWFEKTGQARTTVLTVMERLKEKGFLSRKKINNVFHYSSKRPTANILQSLVGDFVQGVLGGSLAPFVAYLNDAKDLDPNEIAELKKIVREMEESPRKKESPK